ncbi:MAG: tRNA (adenosine(37)-N6)-threonylcarbamoyltransferase complex dimerization subunit type 1 TsaB [Firmicutes bacterium]|nr:tRNA (adenosine(37)-N6)-threonylcarbamoyltransferase complex dimerization subunit type 1 TsaB [Bacillota bacterium]
MTYLFIDTCNSFTVSIIKNDEIIYINKDSSNTDTSSKVMPIIDDAFKSTNLDISNIDKIFVVNGPGSFTGIRVGVTIAKTISYSLNIPLIKISELELLATTPTDNYNVPIIDARRGYVYGAIYDKDLNIYYKESHILFDELKTKLPSDYNIVDNYDNIDLIKLIKKHENDNPINPHELKPNYLKNTEAEEKLNDQRV